MRTNDRDVIDFTWITVPDAATRLSVAPEHVLALGKAGELEVVDLRIPGRKRGVYRVNPKSMHALISRRLSARLMNKEQASPGGCCDPATGE